jgi:hypothetical protein
VHEARFRIARRRPSRQRRRLIAAASVFSFAVAVVLASPATGSVGCAAAALAAACVSLGLAGVLGADVLGCDSGFPENSNIEIHREWRWVSRAGGALTELQPCWLTESLAIFHSGKRRIVLWRDEIDRSDWRRVRSCARWQLFSTRKVQALNFHPAVLSHPSTSGACRSGERDE